MLTKKDLEYLTSGDGNHLITGPPGSGKTRTLLEIIKYLTGARGIEPGSILILTFNRKWSKIIREQSAIRFDGSLWEIPIETFYSFCIDFLELTDLHKFSERSFKDTHKEIAGDTDGINAAGRLRILNSVEQWNLLKSIIKKLDKKDYPGSYRYYNSTEHVACNFLQEVFDFILRAQENLLEPDILLRRFPPESFPMLSELSGIYARYTKKLIEDRSYNYGMLLLKTANILDKELSIRKIFQNRYKYIIVDELQETNKAQFRIVELIIKNNCIFFGNDDQAIYGFRGSVTNNFRELYKKLKTCNRVFFLEVNHRNSPGIIKLSDKFINIIGGRIPKANIPLNKYKHSGHAALKSFSSLLEEVNYICGKILELNRRCGIRPEDIAVLIKGSGYETHLIEEALRLRKIPFIRRSSRSLMENSYVSYIINFLKLAAILNRRISDEKLSREGKINSGKNKNRQKEGGIKSLADSQENTRIDGLIESILNSNIVNIDPLFYSKLKSSYLLRNEKQINFLDYILKCPGISDNGSKNRRQKKLGRVINRIEYFSGKIDCDIFSYIMDFLNDPELGLFRFFKDKSETGPGEQSWVCIGDFLKSVQEYTVKSAEKSVKAYLSYIENLEINRFLEETEESTEEQFMPGAINIMSFHQCKGMEYDAVFIPFINDNYLPSEFKPPQIFDISLFGNAAPGSNISYKDIEREHFSGEVRLFYNGMTRAKKYLYITSCRSRGTSIFFEKLKDVMEGINKNECFPPEGNVDKKHADGKKLDRSTDMDRDWRIKKRLITAMTRLEQGLKIDYGIFLKDIVRLNQLYDSKKWWNLNKNTANSSMPFKIFRKPFSYSGLEAYRNCPFRYMAGYFYNISVEEEFNLKVGKIYHNILSEFFKGKEGIYTWERLQKIIESCFEKQYFEFRPLRDEIISRAKSDLKRYYDNYLPENPEKSVMENAFSFKSGRFRIEGRIDQINFPGDGSLEIVDFKSGSARYSKQDLKEELQLKLYRLAIEKDKKNYGDMRIIMKYINLGEEKNAEYLVPDNYYESREVDRMIKRLASKILNEDFKNNPKNFMSCKNCDYKLICPGFYGNGY
jgi:DNA helicase II / ATP-dependent DNA helicase PcrA